MEQKNGEWYECIDTIFIFLVDCVNKMAASENFTREQYFFGEEESSNLINFFFKYFIFFPVLKMILESLTQ